MSNAHNKEYALLKQNRCIFLYILVWNIFSGLYVTYGHITLKNQFLAYPNAHVPSPPLYYKVSYLVMECCM